MSEINHKRNLAKLLDKIRGLDVPEDTNILDELKQFLKAESLLEITYDSISVYIVVRKYPETYVFQIRSDGHAYVRSLLTDDASKVRKQVSSFFNGDPR